MPAPYQVSFDCADPARLAEFWAAALGYRVQQPPAGFASWPDFLRARGVPQERWNDASAIVDPAGVGQRVFFQRVPGPKTGKNRVHLDLQTGGGRPMEEQHRLVDAEVERLRGLGATSHESHEELGIYWVVMRDPEGNEFCV